MGDPGIPSLWETRTRWLLIGLVLGYLLRGWPEAPAPLVRTVSGEQRVEVVRLHDTIVRDRLRIELRDAPARVRVERVPVVVYVDSSDGRRDTLEARPFEARADTIVGRDTITQLFAFPPPRLSLALRQGPDSLITTREVVTITRQVAVPPPWYEEAAKAVVFMGIGYTTRLLTAH